MYVNYSTDLRLLLGHPVLYLLVCFYTDIMGGGTTTDDTTEKFCLKWNEFETNLSLAFKVGDLYIQYVQEVVTRFI